MSPATNRQSQDERHTQLRTWQVPVPVTVLAIHSIKGGVGKTATAVNLAYHAAVGGRSTLLWDLDPQGAATFYFRIEPHVSGGVEKLLNSKRPIQDPIKATDFDRLDLLPADFSYRHFDLALADWNKPAKQLRKMIAPLAETYSLIVLDCPPGLSVLMENIYKVADALVAPTVPTPLSMRTHEQLLEHLRDNAKRSPRLFAFFSMVDARKRLHRDIMQQSMENPSKFLRTSIPYSSQVERMGEQRAPLATYAPASRAAVAYSELWTEIDARLNLESPSFS